MLAVLIDYYKKFDLEPPQHVETFGDAYMFEVHRDIRWLRYWFDTLGATASEYFVRELWDWKFPRRHGAVDWDAVEAALSEWNRQSEEAAQQFLEELKAIR